MATATPSVSDTTFETEVIGADRPVLVYFWANWCGPCRLVSPSVQAISDNYGDRLKVVKMEVDPNPETVKRYEIHGIPYLLLLKDGEVLTAHEGAITKAKLEEKIVPHLGDG